MKQNDDPTKSFVPLTKGTEVSQYRIIKKIDEGGMGEVYLAEDTKLNNKVALKFLASRFVSDESSKERFTREAQAVASLDHPNIVAIHELNEYKGRPYFAMQYVQGQSLWSYAKQTKLSTDRVVELAMQLCEGLQAAHEKGITHRDIKPSNILIDSHGRLRIVDFGLASVQGTDRLTKTGSTLGTVGYMSPEQVRGEKVDHRSDLFSMGVVLYELLSGLNPFKAESEAATMHAITQDNPQPLARFNREVPDVLQRIIDKALAKDPSLRYQHADGMLSDLKRLKTDAGQPVTSRIGLRVGAAVMVLAAVAVLYSFWPKGSPVEEDTVIMLAVLPFENLGSPEDEYFADGITEEITARLAGVRDLGVIARTSVMKYRGTNKSIAEIGAELGVDYVLEGTVRWQKSGSGVDRVRVTPQLINVSDGTHKWANIYDEVMAEVFTVQSDIAKGITEALGIALGIEEQVALVERHTDNVEAYDFYLRGNDYWYQARGGDNETSMRLANKRYGQALNADPTYVPALARLARTEIELYWHHTYDSTNLNEAWRYLQRALTFDSNSVDAKIALGSYYYHDHEYDKSLAEFFRILERQPNNSDVLMEIAYVYQRRGNFEEALKNRRLVAKFDPLRVLHIVNIAYNLAMLRRFDEAEKTYYQAIVLAPDLPTAYAQLSRLIISRDRDLKRARKLIADAEPIVKPNFAFYYRGFVGAVWDGDFRSALRYSDLLRPFDGGDEQYHSRMAFIYRMQDKREQERAQADSAYAILKEGARPAGRVGFVHQMLGTALARMGRFEEAIEHGKKAVELEILRYLLDGRMFALAWIYLESGDEAAALDILEKILNTPNFATTKSIQLDPQFKPLHDHPRFKEMMKKYETLSS